MLSLGMNTQIRCQGTTCGYFWSELLQSVVTITNSCDRAGTIANELPVTEQIPVSASDGVNGKKFFRLAGAAVVHNLSCAVQKILRNFEIDWNFEKSNQYRSGNLNPQKRLSATECFLERLLRCPSYV